MNAIRSNRQVYRVGERQVYVYWLVQSMTDLVARAERANELCAKYGLTRAERLALVKMLSDLDSRRAGKRSKPRRPATKHHCSAELPDYEDESTPMAIREFLAESEQERKPATPRKRCTLCGQGIDGRTPDEDKVYKRLCAECFRGV